MSNILIDRRGLLALAGGLAFASHASAKAMSRPATEPLDIITSQGRAHFNVELADNDAQRERGLMFRKSLGPDQGMLFDFHREQEVAFWMKNTLISLDMLFIRTDGHVYSVARNAIPQSLQPIPSGGPVRAVLEIAGGRAAQIGVLPGDRILHRIFPRG